MGVRYTIDRHETMLDILYDWVKDKYRNYAELDIYYRSVEVLFESRGLTLKYCIDCHRGGVVIIQDDHIVSDLIEYSTPDFFDRISNIIKPL